MVIENPGQPLVNDILCKSVYLGGLRLDRSAAQETVF